MDAYFSFALDRPRGLVRIVMAGLFEPDDVARFLEARRRAHQALGCAPNRHLTLNDVRGMKIQPQRSVAAFGELLADPEHRSLRLAFLVGPTLARSQLMRALAGREGRCFADPAQAEAWLLEEEEAAVPREVAAFRALLIEDGIERERAGRPGRAGPPRRAHPCRTRA